jgi:hypothetical protein
VTLFYTKDLERGVVLKYWGIYFALFAVVLLAGPLISAILQLGVAIGLASKTIFSSSLLD